MAAHTACTLFESPLNLLNASANSAHLCPAINPWQLAGMAVQLGATPGLRGGISGSGCDEADETLVSLRLPFPYHPKMLSRL